MTSMIDLLTQPHSLMPQVKIGFIIDTYCSRLCFQSFNFKWGPTNQKFFSGRLNVSRLNEI
jgi:hypothetical protein